MMYTHISEAQKKQYQDEGYFVFENAITPEQLKEMQTECDALIKAQDDEMEATGKDTLGLSRKNSRYFVFNAYKERPYLAKFLFSDLMADLCKATIGDTAYLFWEQFVVKGTDKIGAEFGWHQDSGYVDGDHKYYVNFWIPLDDVSEENGTISILPYSKAGTDKKIEHVTQPDGDRHGYFGEEKGELMDVKAGSIVIFSSVAFHRSGANSTDKMRRAWALQYSPEIIYEKDGSLKGLDEKLLENGNKLK